MEKRINDEVVIHIIVAAFAMWIGVGVREWVLQLRGDGFAAIVAFIGAVAIILALYFLFSSLISDIVKLVCDKYFRKTPVVVKDVAKSPRQSIEHDTIFMKGAFEKLQTLEKRLIADDYLSEDLRWNAKYNGRKNIKSLVIFLTGLVEEKYFLPNRDPRIKAFFEDRYGVSLGQNFERSRREKYSSQHHATFYNYPF